MTQRQREAAVQILHNLPPGQTLTAPVLAEMIDADPDDLPALLAQPVALCFIRTYRCGAVHHWCRAVEAHNANRPVRARVSRAEDGGVSAEGILRDPGAGDRS